MSLARWSVSVPQPPFPESDLLLCPYTHPQDNCPSSICTRRPGRRKCRHLSGCWITRDRVRLCCAISCSR